MTTGDPQNTAVKSEIIDLLDAETTCQSLEDYPLPVTGAFGGRLDDVVPVVCGGAHYGKAIPDCYVLGLGEESEKLTALSTLQTLKKHCCNVLYRVNPENRRWTFKQKLERRPWSRAKHYSGLHWSSKGCRKSKLECL